MYFYCLFVNNKNGDFMRKYFILIIIIMLFIFSYLIFTKRDNNIPVFSEKVNYYDLYVLDLSKENFNTNNIMAVFDDVVILEIYPYVNPVYKNIIGIDCYKFNTILSNKKNISLFMNEYINKLENNNLKEEIVKYRLNGVKINKIMVYTSNVVINKLINNHNIKIVKR